MTTKTEHTSKFRFNIGCVQIPHPEKAKTGGEDAFFVSEYAIGVADGVGSYSYHGINPGIFSKRLIKEIDLYFKSNLNTTELKKPVLHSLDIVTQEKIEGGTTLCLAALNEDEVIGLNYGDSGFIIIREGKISYETQEGVHDFNFPHQLDHLHPMNDTEARVESFKVQSKDILIMATDGLFDNVYKEQILEIVTKGLKEGVSLNLIASTLADIASKNGCDPKFASPFAKAAREYGYNITGGKLDDITIIVAMIVPVDETTASTF